MRAFIPNPRINPCVIKFYPVSIASNERVIVPTFRTTNVHDKAFKNIDSRFTTFRIEVTR